MQSLKCSWRAGCIGIGLAVISFALPAAAGADTVEDFQQWTTISGSGSIKGDIVGQFDINVRSSANAGRVTQLLPRATIGYRLSPSVTIATGYGHIVNYRAGLRDNAEERFYQQVAWTIGKIGAGTLSTRMRLEQRFVRPGSDLGWRYRQQVRYALPVKRDGTVLLFQTEPFFALNSTDWGARAGFDQVRVMAGVAVPISKRATLETGYQVQYVRGAAFDRLNHVVPLTLALRL